MSSRVLSRQIEAIEYVHAADGERYRHDFTRGDSRVDLRKDGSVVIRNGGNKKLWDTFVVDGHEQEFLVNPRGVRDHTVRRGVMAKKKKARSAAQRAATRALVAMNRHRSNAPTHAKPKKKKKYSIARYVSASRAKPHKRNPPAFSGRGLIRQATQGVVDAVWILGGKLFVQFVSSKTPFDDGSLTDTGVEVGTALVMGLVLPRVIGIDRARMAMAGMLLSPLETLAKQAKLPGITPLLSGLPGADTRLVYGSGDLGNGARRVAGYVPGPSRIGDYPQPSASPMGMPAHSMA